MHAWIADAWSIPSILSRVRRATISDSTFYRGEWRFKRCFESKIHEVVVIAPRQTLIGKYGLWENQFRSSRWFLEQPDKLLMINF